MTQSLSTIGNRILPEFQEVRALLRMFISNFQFTIFNS
ncbi:MAG: hypothetical protein UY87_C0005G0012 [Candidatus Peribacteria bacterium GW2011_GWC2_54_8]|nr:MAG: hypothetical protein UY87_C0005G0012 [Candidatus Peribacteria bacterium GW2011_GWC2_54_8]